MALSKQHLDYFATIAEIIAAVGVMISVIYLAIQINGSNKELRAQSYNDAMAMSVNGRFDDIGRDDLLAVAERFGVVDASQALAVARQAGALAQLPADNHS